jgi:hypothetical protein
LRVDRLGVALAQDRGVVIQRLAAVDNSVDGVLDASRVVQEFLESCFDTGEKQRDLARRPASTAATRQETTPWRFVYPSA